MITDKHVVILRRQAWHKYRLSRGGSCSGYLLCSNSLQNLVVLNKNSQELSVKVSVGRNSRAIWRISSGSEFLWGCDQRVAGGWHHCKGLSSHISGTCAEKTQQLGAVGDLWASLCIGLVSLPAWWFTVGILLTCWLRDLKVHVSKGSTKHNFLLLSPFVT